MAASGFTLAKLSFTTAFQVVLDNYNTRRTPEKLEWIEGALKEMMDAVDEARRTREKTTAKARKRKEPERPSSSSSGTDDAAFDAMDEFLRSIQTG